MNLAGKVFHDKLPRVGTNNTKLLLEFIKTDKYSLERGGKTLELYSSKYKLTVSTRLNSDSKLLLFAYVKDKSDVPKVIGKTRFDLDKKDSEEFAGKQLSDIVKGARNIKILSDILIDIEKVTVRFNEGHVNDDKFVKAWIVKK